MADAPLTSKTKVSLEKRMSDGSCVFVKDGTYFRLTDDDVYDLVELIEGGPLPGPADETSSCLQVTRETIEVLSRYIVKNCNYDRLRDHACPQCMPEGGPLVNPNFVCAYHLAEEYARQASPPFAVQGGDILPPAPPKPWKINK